jgi:hypothetical protein
LFGLSRFAVLAARVVLIGAIIRLFRLCRGRVSYQLTETFLTAVFFVAGGHFVMKSTLPYFVTAILWSIVVAVVATDRF